MKAILRENRIHFSPRKAAKLLVGKGAERYNSRGRGLRGIKEMEYIEDDDGGDENDE